ncbi:TPA: hypothetical protein QCK11_004852 [Enterobacter asburiae]|nr:hypothetical protein [Enterobacter asburiae]
MSNLALNLNIEGDYIDSFIYSGVLYLLDSDFKFTSYSWNALCDFILKRNGFKFDDARLVLGFSKDNRLVNKSINHIDTCLDRGELLSLRKDVVEIKTWPSDINIFSNKLYFSGDEGVFFINTNHLTAEFDKENIQKVFGMKGFSISPNTNNRIALAVGREGVFTSTLKYGIRTPSEVQVSDSSSIDVDWLDESLFVNSDNLIVKDFHKIIHKKDIESNDLFMTIKREMEKEYDGVVIDSGKIISKSYRKYLDIALSYPPKTLKLNDHYRYGWSSGDCNFVLNKKNEIVVQNKMSGGVEKIAIPGDFADPEKIRTSGCGTIIEFNDGQLFSISGDGISLISNDFASWRVFPRAKNHANHLHLINEDNINIKVYNKKESNFNSFLSREKDEQYKYGVSNFIEGE